MYDVIIWWVKISLLKTKVPNFENFEKKNKTDYNEDFH